MVDHECKCGFATSDVSEFKAHLLVASKEGKGLHSSLHPKKKNRRPNGDKGDAARTPAKAVTLAEAVRVRIIPREFALDSSNLFWQAMEVAINEWGWPEDIRPQDFLDTYLYVTMKQRGIILGGYQVQPPAEMEDDGNN